MGKKVNVMQKISLLPERPAVCLVTEELPGVGGCGGIGAAFHELALLLAARGALVDILFCPLSPLSDAEMVRLQEKFRDKSIKISFLDMNRYVDGPVSHERRAYAVYRQIEAARRYDFIHFHDYKGLGFFCVNAKKQGLAFETSLLVVQLHGPTRWTIEANKTFFVHEDQLKIDHLERVSIRNADYVVSPSAYLVQWLRENDFELPPVERVVVLKNVCSNIVRELQADTMGAGSGPVTDLVMFARHEDRKGFAVFCDALDRLDGFLAGRNIGVTFMGKFGMVDSQPSGVYLIDRSRKWSFGCKVRTGCDRSGVAAYLASLRAPMVVVPSPFENSPYTVLETVAIGVPLISSVDGGGPELLEPDYPGLCEIEAAALAQKIRWAIENGLEAPRAAQSLGEIEDAWLEFHRQQVKPRKPGKTRQPKVAFAITHYERPSKLVDALISVVRQSYSNIEIILVDDGSRSEATINALAQLEPFISRIGARLIRRENGYLGAARNTALAATDAEYICFLDDDDYAFPNLIEHLVEAAVATDADVINCLNSFMPESNRPELIAGLGGAEPKVCYVPIAGPLSIAVSENSLGAATALIRTSALRSIGGYTEIKGVGHEDYELFLRMLQAGMKIEIVPKPLYLYEVGRPSMLSRTSMVKNFRRCFDACELPPDSPVARDLLSLILGKKVAVDAHNRLWWQYSLLPTSDLRHQLMSHSLSREDALSLLIRLAQSEGNQRIAMAFAEDLRSSTAPRHEFEDGDLVSLHVQAARPCESTVPIYDPRLADIKLEAALGRGDLALDKLIGFVKDTRSLAQDFYQVAFEVLRRTDSSVHVAQYRELNLALSSKRVPKAQVLDARVLLASLEYMSGRSVPVNALREIVAADEAAYLSMYADVANAVDAGLIGRGAEHYALFGLREGRGGFDSIGRIASILQDCKLDVGADDLIEVACRP
ncbi:glycosyl transferases group 1 family protein [Lysobacter gummosus]|nr:glycosyl transferases group 1 family protein [Lysobacter gummosus]